MWQIKWGVHTGFTVASGRTSQLSGLSFWTEDSSLSYRRGIYSQDDKISIGGMRLLTTEYLLYNQINQDTLFLARETIQPTMQYNCRMAIRNQESEHAISFTKYTLLEVRHGNLK